jgi:hypothetical protein
VYSGRVRLCAWRVLVRSLNVVACVSLVIWRERPPRHGIDHVPVTINDMRTEYFVNVSVGSPRQTFTVLIDTASSTLAIFSKLAPTHGRLAVNDGELDRRLKVRLCHVAGEQIVCVRDRAAP